MAERREKIPKDILRELDEEEEVLFRDNDLYEAGSETIILKDMLTRIVQCYVENPTERKRIQALVKWFPGKNMEEYLVMALQYAADKVMPRPATRRRRQGR